MMDTDHEHLSDPDACTKASWTREQKYLETLLVLKDDFSWDLQTLKFIAGVDISFVKSSDVDACASLVVLSFPDFQVVHTAFEMVKLTLPYVPGFLAFREVPHLVKLIDDLRVSRPDVMPQVILVDGNGIFHPRGLGLASHLGVLCDIPTVGVGKTHFLVDGISLQRARELERGLSHAGQAAELVGDSGRVWGALLRCTEASVKAVYVSVGHRIGLSTALELVRRCCLFRIPEPVRQADLMSREFIRKLGLE
eukprot:TRINITY_DN3704_c0_g1_i3.p1 TRINITY_DN3704_c0_g1~~TRINITY_DN3704_c0_g1_i3.p1  ORF type:complete len:252 (-),score=33.56 TRINITY_DN3704_c0_g1_i3:157-912(-)